MSLKSKAYYLTHVSETEPQEIAEAIMAGVVSFEELQDTMDFSGKQQGVVRDLLSLKNAIGNATSVLELDDLLRRPNLPQEDRDKISQRILHLKAVEEEALFNFAKNVKDYQDFITKYPSSIFLRQAREKIEELSLSEKIEREKAINKILDNIHNEDVEVIRKKYGEETLKQICDRLNINYTDVLNIRDVKINNTGDKPQSVSQIPTDFTDVFFWGLPSSGKSCALASIFNTLKNEYVIIDPSIPQIFGRPYRVDLSGLFNKDGIGYLPQQTPINAIDTHYMPFVIKDRNSDKKINLSFFEISGEIFKLFKLLVDDTNATIHPNIQPTLDLLNTVLISPNPKIHFFFIDYQHEKNVENKVGIRESQEAFLDGAAQYFKRTHDIFRHHTLSIHIVITKADLLPKGDRKKEAENFLNENFGSFVEQIKLLKVENSIQNKTKVFPFSIGDVYFNSMCRLNPNDPKLIIETLLSEIKPKKKGWPSFGKILNS
jgi:hypothetical protein